MMDRTSSGTPRACLVVSHYNAWPEDKLLALLDQTMRIASGIPFHTRVVVNQAVDRRLELPARFAHVEVLHRPNTGYNIGAWEHGWRTGPAFPTYLFVQEECQILRRGWMEAFDREASKPEVGLVGESVVCDCSWDLLMTDPPETVEGVSQGDPAFFAGLYAGLLRLGVAPGDDGRHLQSLAFAARREVLERIDGFPLGGDWMECVVAEVAISKKVQAAGLETAQIDRRRFRYVLHPQWVKPLWKRAARQGLKWAPASLRRRIETYRRAV